MRSLMRRFTLALLCVPLLVGLAGCNTIHGMGQDIQKSGEWIQDSANGNDDSAT